jgi:hypothetical protein
MSIDSIVSLLMNEHRPAALLDRLDSRKINPA